MDTEATRVDFQKEIKISTHTGHVVHAPFGISATYSPFQEPAEPFFKKGMHISYAMELLMPQGVIPTALYQDTENPYHYFRVDTTPKGERIIIGGEDHRADLPVSPEKSFAALKTYAESIFPGTSLT